MNFTADQVWGLAVRADTLNGGYFTEQLWEYPEGMPPVLKKEANKTLVKSWLREQYQPTDEEVAAGREYRAHFKSYTLRAISGKLNDFEHQCLLIANMDEFSGRDLYQFSIVSCMPEMVRRDRIRSSIKRDLYCSTQLAGTIGDTVVIDIDVVYCKHNTTYNKWRVQARAGDSFVDFWIGRDISQQSSIRIKAKIKAHRSDKSTQLHYVKIV